MAQVHGTISGPAPSAHAETEASNDGRRLPLQYSGSLDSYKSFDVTPIIGREFPDLQLSSLLSDDRKLRDLAIIVSQRGVVFFRSQDLELGQQKILGEKLGRLTGKPPSSKLHRHALTDKKLQTTVDGEPKPEEEVMVISSETAKSSHKGHTSALKPLASTLWHSDITFEHVPSDYAILKMTIVPGDSGGDTIWASGYEAYDRLSPAWKRFAETLTATHHNATLKKLAQGGGADLIEGDRGSPDNKGLDFEASHPVVRTNPVTGWKSLMAAGHQVHEGRFDNVTPREDQILKAYFLQLVVENHDLQVRFKWRENDIVIWDKSVTVRSLAGREADTLTAALAFIQQLLIMMENVKAIASFRSEKNHIWTQGQPRDVSRSQSYEGLEKFEVRKFRVDRPLSRAQRDAARRCFLSIA